MRRPLPLVLAFATGLSGLAFGVPTASAAADPSTEPSAADTSASAPAASDELLVGYQPGATDSARARARARAEARLAERVVVADDDRGEVERVLLPRGRERGQAIAAFRSDPSVRYAEPNWTVEALGKPTASATALSPAPVTRAASDPRYLAGDTWGLQGGSGSAADVAWSYATGTVTTYVGVIDEGIDVDHPDLVGQVGNPGELGGAANVDDDGNGLVDDVHGYDFAGVDNASVYDGPGDDHGTHVAGTIAAKHDTVGVPGVAKGAVKLISGKFLGANGGSIADAVQAVDYFTDLKTKRGVNVVATSNSWGGGGYSQALLDAVVRAAKAEILFVAAAGNSGSNNDRRASYPSNYSTLSGAGYDAVVAVAALDRTGALASFSQYGATTVDLGAPGVDVLSTVPGGYAYYSGTSMATPHVSGALAYYASVRGAETAQARRKALFAAVAPTRSISSKTSTGGRLDVSSMLPRP